MTVRILTGDCRELMADEGPFDLIIADPPYGDTSLDWDRRVFGWTQIALQRLKPTGSMWVFGSMRFMLHLGTPAGFRYAQDIVWEKHNGSGFAADRFKRVHELAVQFYRADSPWGAVFNEVPTTPDAANRAPEEAAHTHWPHRSVALCLRRRRPAHHAVGHLHALHARARNPPDRKAIAPAGNSDPHQLPGKRLGGRLLRGIGGGRRGERDGWAELHRLRNRSGHGCESAGALGRTSIRGCRSRLINRSPVKVPGMTSN
jgi:hypothetical protein